MAKRNRGRGEGTIYKRSDGGWRVQVYVNGQRISFGAKTKVECITWLNQMQYQLEQGFDYQGGKIALGDYLDQWLEGYIVAIRPKTHHQYVRIVKRFIKPQIGKMPIKDIRPFDVERFYSTLLKDGVGVRTIRTCHSVLHRALEKALGYGLVMRNPAHGVTLPNYRHAEMLVWDDSQVVAFLVAANESAFKALYHLAVTTGMRQGEIFGLKWSDLHWVSGTLQVQRQVQRVPGQGWFLAEPKTKNGRRMIKLGEGTLHELRLHKQSQQHHIAITGECWVNNNLIFANKVGNPLDPSNLRIDFNKIISAASLTKIRFHDLRHTAASLMLNNGVPPIVVSRILGHSRPSITLDIYGHLYHELQGEAARIMDELVTPVYINFSKTEEPISRQE